MRTARLIKLANVLIASLLATTADSSAATIFVDDSATGLANGQSWQDAFTSLQDALATAVSGDEVWIAEGTYRPDDGSTVTPGDRMATFALVNNVDLYGGFFGGETSVAARGGSAEKTILTGDLNGDDQTVGTAENSLHVMTATGITSAIVDRVTIAAGNANLSGNVAGGGILITTASPTFRDCRIVNNQCGDDGAGVTARSTSAPVFIGCLFFNNSATDVGGGAWITVSSVTFIHTQFIGNASGRLGGGVYYFGPSAGVSDIVGCTFTGNTALDRGGAVFVSSANSAPNFVGCTIADNDATNTGGGIFGTTSTVVTNCIAWNNSDATGINETSQLSQVGAVNYSCITGLGSLPGTGNIGSDPMLMNVAGVDGIVGTLDDDVGISAGSPCLDVGDSAAFPQDMFDLDSDGNVTEPFPVDLAGGPRFFDDPIAPNGGAGPMPFVDMGAYEGPTVTNPMAYGQGCPGSGGFIPTLQITGTPAAGNNVTLSINNALGGATSILLLGLNQAAIPVGSGCLLLVTPVLPAQFTLPLGGAGPGNGGISLFAPLPPGTTGFQFTTQGFVIDPGVSQGFAATNGVDLTIE